ncbi:MAG: DMT family transporter [Gammaproteobacteria bacterium]
MTFRVWLAFLALCLLWGVPYFFIKQAVHELAPVCIAWGRLLFGALVLLPVAWKTGGLRNIRQHQGAIICFALAELVGPFYLIALGESWVSSSMAGILLSAVPLMVVILAPFLGVKERLGWKRLIGLLVGVVGVVALLGIDSLHSRNEWIGAACILLATVGYATGPLIIQRYLSDVDTLGMVAASVTIGAVVLTIPALMSLPASVPSASAISAVLILGVLCTAAGLLLFAYVISHAGASRATVVTYVNPAVAVLLGVLILNEHFGVGSAVGLLLILFGSWLATSGSKTAH